MVELRTSFKNLYIAFLDKIVERKRKRDNDGDRKEEVREKNERINRERVFTSDIH